jgi:membrane protease YdiL (CAAX protease family)
MESVRIPRRFRVQILSSALAGVIFAAICIFIAVPLFPPEPHHTWGPFAAAISNGGWPRHAWALLAVLLAPPVEEFLFRGIVFAGLAPCIAMHAAYNLGLVVSVYANAVA